MNLFCQYKGKRNRKKIYYFNNWGKNKACVNNSYRPITYDMRTFHFFN